MMAAKPPPSEWSLRRAKVAHRVAEWLRLQGQDVSPESLLPDEDVPSLEYVDDATTEEIRRGEVEALLERMHADDEDRLQ